MGLQDILLTPLYLIVIYAIAYRIRNKYYKHNLLKKYFIPALTCKIAGAIAIGLIYQFYYGGGDTFNYYTYGSARIWDAFQDDPATAFNLIFAIQLKKVIRYQIWGRSDIRRSKQARL